MDKDEFVAFRKKLGKTQSQMAQLLGVSVKAVHSYEQGWRSVPAHVEKQMLFLVSQAGGNKKRRLPCWELKQCPEETRDGCPAYEYQAGKLCWMISGTMCEGRPRKSWNEKMKICRRCQALTPVLNGNGMDRED